jgi:PAS domain S-box-containing protein
VVAHTDRQLLDDRLLAFIDRGPLTVYVNRADEASSNVYMSPQLEAILGYTAEEWGADPDFFRKVLHPDDRERVIAEQLRTRDAGEPFRAEYRMVTRDGEIRWFLDETHEIAGEAGRPRQRYGYLVEITKRKELEDALRRAEERYRRLVERLPLAIYIDRLDEFSSNVYTSPHIERMTGYTAERWAAEADFFVKILHPDDRERVIREHERTHTTRAPLRVEYRLIAADGREIWIRDEAVVVRDRDGASPVLQGFLVDITEQKVAEQALRESEAELRRQKAHYQQLHQLSPVAIVTLDMDQNVASWNPAAESLFGYSEEEALGRHLEELLFPTADLLEESRAVQQLADTEGLAHVLARRARKDGALVDVEVLVVPLVVDGERTGYLVLYHDVSELLRARKNAEAATEAKSAFLATMSHEIRTPMNAVIGMGGLLLDTDLTDEQHEFAEVIRTSSEALLRIIDDILDFSKIEAGKLELEEHAVELRACAESALDLVAVAASDKGIELGCLVEADVPEAILADPTRLRQALGNLLSNAVKFTDGGEVVLAVTSVEDRGGDMRRLRFSVHDTGIGIPAERMHRLFDSFSQVDASTTRRYGGTGLGLAISQRLAEIMGGTLWVESKEGEGSTFHFEVVARATAAPERPERAGGARDIAGKRLLVVDDNATNREIVRRLAESWGMDVEVVHGSAEALELIRRGDPFDVAVLDMQMPGMDGLELAREIRRHRDARALPLLLLTSIGHLAEARGASEFSAQLTKPVKSSQLYDVLLRLVAGGAPAAAADDDGEGADRGTVALRLLVAEDNEFNRQLAVALLRKLGYEPDLARNGREALDALARAPYDVVLMDVQMPELDGLEATRVIRDRFGSGAPRIIAMTANAMEGDRDECLAAGMDDYLAKPIHVDELARALARWRPARAATLDRAVLGRLVSSLGGGDEGRQIVAGLVDTFLDAGADRMATVRDSVERGDADEMRRAAHNLKSNAATFGAETFAELCRELEALGRDGELDAAPKLVERAEAEWARVSEDLSAACRAGAP